MIKRFIMMLFFSLYTQTASSNDLYSIEISSNDFQSITQTFTDIDSLIDATEQSSISGITGYNQNSGVDIAIQLGNLPATISYQSNSSDLAFSIDECGISKTFTGASRTANENEFRDYIENNEEDVLGKLSGCLVENNPHDPVAVTIRDWVEFTGAFTHSSNIEDQQENFGVGLVAGHFSTGDQSHSILTLPLSYTHYYKEKGRKLKLSAPISVIDVNGSRAFKINLGVDYSLPMNNRWTIIPATRVGITASKDMGTSSTLASVLLTNLYEFPYGDKHITLANMVGAITTIDLDIGNLDSYYDLSNQVIKNGIAVEFPQTYNMFGGKTSIQASLANTQFFGDQMKVDNYTDIAISFGTRRKVGGKDNNQDSIQLGFTYTLGNNGYKGENHEQAFYNYW